MTAWVCCSSSTVSGASPIRANDGTRWIASTSRRWYSASGKFADALDLTKEDPKLLEQYTPRLNLAANLHAEGPILAQALMARRLVEAGVRVVNVSISDFDTHSKNFPRMRNLVPIVDHALAT